MSTGLPVGKFCFSGFFVVVVVMWEVRVRGVDLN